MDIRPIAYVNGMLLIPLGAFMFPSAILDLADGQQSWTVFASCGALTMAVGTVIALAARGGETPSLSIRQAFLLTTSVWVIMPLAGSVPFIVGEPDVSLTDAYFEAMSGITTTGSTVFVGLDDMPKGLLLWRGVLQWLGGLGIVIVAFVFLPLMRVGGMQFFKSEGFDTLGKILPRAADISWSLIRVYVCLTALCTLAYIAFGMNTLDATVHALTTMSTGGFSTSDQSFAKFVGPLEYVSVVFMVLASLPFIRFVQVLSGSTKPLLQDVQVRAYIRWIAIASMLVIAYRLWKFEGDYPAVVRESLFNIVTLFSGTGYGSADVTAWGSFPLAVIFCVGLIGGCTASTGCSIKVFRWLVAIEAIKQQLGKIAYPHRVSTPHLDNKPISDDVMNSVANFFMFFLLTMGLVIAALSLTGLENLTAITAGWTAIANVGPAFGPEVGPTGAMAGFPTPAKWIMIAAMLLGRLELLSVIVLFVPAFWRN